MIAKTANNFLKDCRAVLREHCATDPVFRELIGLTDVRVVHFVLNKPDPARGLFASLDAIGHRMCLDLANATQKEVISRWIPTEPLPCSHKDDSKTAMSSAPIAKVIDQSGVWTNSVSALTQRGFVNNVLVKHSKSGRVYKISEVTDACVKLRDFLGSFESSHSHTVFLDGQYSIWVDKADIVEDHLSFEASRNVAWMWSLLEFRVRTAMHSVHEENKECLSGLIPAVAPFRAVTAGRDFDVGAIVLPPLTTTIGKLDCKSEPSPGQVSIDEKFKHPVTQAKYRVVLNPSGGMRLPNKKQESTGIGTVRADKGDHLMSLYWYVRCADDNRKANMRVEMIEGLPCLKNHKKIKMGS